jgi:SpoVK/Ycf46/Vps4 family AAA+-type ATPase
VYVRERPGASGQSLGLTALARLGRPALGLDLGRMAAGDDPALIAVAASREARLRGAGLVVGPVEPLVERGATAVRAFAELPGPVILVGGRDWDPAWSRDPPLVVDAPVPALATRHDLWVTSLNGDQPEGFDPAAATIAFRLTPEQIDRAAQAARHAATAADRTMTVADVAAGARAQNAAGLERLARRIEPSVAWKDLVLPGVVEAQLRELTARARHRDRVVGEWRMGTTGARGIGITALFAGDSGTGKTMSAEVVGHDLALDVYVIDLSTVVDKYIGETEKNLDRIFTEADRVNGILLFDEADALFGKRSEVKDARDRYANVEVAYLLQRMERFDGVAILTTNLRSNVDEAFVRRLDAIIDFPMPEEEHRRLLWERNLAPELPVQDGIDLDFLARRFKISGGNIRNVCVTAAYLAAAADRPVSMADLVRATEREYRKLGRLTVEAEFGEYYDLVTATE